MSTRVNATLAGCLLGYSEKTMRKWFKDGTVKGAEKVSRPGMPEEWEIELSVLVREAGHLLKQDRVRVMAQFIDMVRGSGGSGGSGGNGGVGSNGPHNGNDDWPPLPSGRLPEPSPRIPGTFRNATEAARWMMTHGIHAESTVKSWPGWPPSRLDPANVLALAIERQDTGNWRITWRLHECDNPTCVCHTML